MVTRQFNANRVPTAVTVTSAGTVNRLQGTNGIRPNIVFRNVTPSFAGHHHHFHSPFRGSGFPFFGYGYPYFPYGGYTNPYDYTNPYAVAGAYGYDGPYYASGVNPYIVAGSGDQNPYGTSGPMQPDTSARLQVVVPDANAEVWLNGEKTTGQGETRTFTTPPLEPGATQAVTVKVAWRETGQNQTVERTVNVTPGAQVRVEFSKTPVRVTGP